MVAKAPGWSCRAVNPAPSLFDPVFKIKPLSYNAVGPNGRDPCQVEEL